MARAVAANAHGKNRTPESRVKILDVKNLDGYAVTVSDAALTVRFTAEQAAKLAVMAEAEDRSKSSVVRRLVDSLAVSDLSRVTSGRTVTADRSKER
jgi:hypothetical protein